MTEADHLSGTETPANASGREKRGALLAANTQARQTQGNVAAVSWNLPVNRLGLASMTLSYQ